MRLHLIGLPDNLPCAWPEVDILTSSPLDARCLDPFRLKHTMLNPGFPVFLSAGVSPVKIIQRARVYSFHSGAYEPRVPDSISSWSADELPLVETPHRLLFDFDANVQRQAHILVLTMARKHGGEAAPHVTRSYGDSPQLKRKMSHICVARADDYPGRDGFLDSIFTC